MIEILFISILIVLSVVLTFVWSKYKHSEHTLRNCAISFAITLVLVINFLLVFVIFTISIEDASYDIDGVRYDGWETWDVTTPYGDFHKCDQQCSLSDIGYIDSVAEYDRYIVVVVYDKPKVYVSIDEQHNINKATSLSELPVTVSRDDFRNASYYIEKLSGPAYQKSLKRNEEKPSSLKIGLLSLLIASLITILECYFIKLVRHILSLIIS